MVLLILIASLLAGIPEGNNQTQDNTNPSPVRENALKVLNEKCNICHRRQNPRKVFTDTNIDQLAPAIYKQVFVKKRMPRGNTIKLTETDQKALMDWIRTRLPIE